MTGAIKSVAIDMNASGKVKVTFEVKTAAGVPVTGAKNFEFTIAKLKPVTVSKPAYWQSYINRSTQSTGGAKVLRAAGERQVATEVSPGLYEYTFCTPLQAVATFKYYGSGSEPADTCSAAAVGRSGVLDSAAAKPVLDGLDVVYEPGATHRLAVVNRDTGATYNAAVDFVPSSLPTLVAPAANQVVTDASCGACHAVDSSDRAKVKFGVHGDRRYQVAVCTTCHGPTTFDSATSTDTKWAPIDLKTMAHKLHASAAGYKIGSNDYSHVMYPQNAPFGGVGAIGAGFNSGAAAPGVMNCRTCHDNLNPKIAAQQPASRSAADKNAWKEKISQQACGTCHDGSVASNVDFSNHQGLSFIQAGNPVNDACEVCHGTNGAVPVAKAHATPYPSYNNPELSAGAKKVEYEIASVTVDAATGRPTVKFRVLVDGAPLDLKSLPTTEIAIGSVNMRLAWSAPMPAPTTPTFSGPAIAKPLDWNNFGSTAGRTYWNDAVSLNLGAYDQPPGVNLSTAGVIVSLTGPDADGWFTTVPGINPAAPLAFPTNKGELSLRAVAIESYLSINSMNISGKSALKGVDGTNTLRRAIVDIDNCNTCHERVGFHSNAGRMNNPDYCATCHNPEITSSNVFAGNAMYSGENRYYSQKPNNFKDMVHSIHAGAQRKAQNPLDPFNFIRGNPNGTGGAGPMVFEDVVYPAQISDCQSCHLPGTYKVPANDQYAWSAIDVQPSLVSAASLATFNPALTIRQGPGTAACGSCHNGTPARAHFAQMTTPPLGESCNVCHGPGSAYEVHK